MNGKVKGIFTAVVTGITTLFAIIGGIALYNHGKSDGRIEADSEDLRNTTEQLESANKRFGEILQEIEKTKHDTDR